MLGRSKDKPRKRRVRRALARAGDRLVHVPGPSPNPATNLLILDVAMRGASFLAARAMQRALLSARYDSGKARDIVMGRSMVRSMVANGAARVASRSVPGFLIVSGGLLAKAVVDRSLGRRRAKQEGEKQFAEQAAEAQD